MTPLITIITPTYNKEEYLPDAIRSVLGLTFQEWEWWIVLDNANEATRRIAFHIRDPRVRVYMETFPEKDRFKECRSAKIINEYFPRVWTPYIFWLSDDDLLHPEGLGKLAKALEEHQDWDVVYGRCQITHELRDGNYADHGELLHGPDVGLGCTVQPCCVLDGGQILQTQSAYEALDGWQLTTAMHAAAECDGIYLNELAKHFVFHYVDTPLVVHRRTKKSVFCTPEKIGDHR